MYRIVENVQDGVFNLWDNCGFLGSFPSIEDALEFYYDIDHLIGTVK